MTSAGAGTAMSLRDAVRASDAFPGPAGFALPISSAVPASRNLQMLYNVMKM